MSGTVDLVIAGAGAGAMAAAMDAARQGLRVLVVIRSARARRAARLRKCLQTAGVLASQVTIITNAEIACVDGINGVEAVVVRHLDTGRLRSFNVSWNDASCTSAQRCSWATASGRSGR